MAANFKIHVHKNRNDLDLRLFGDFDGTSACELLNVLKEQGHRAARISIDTKGLKGIAPFGVDTFQNSLYLVKDRAICLVFTGEHAGRISPERNQFF